jgi:hypothetical protein
MAFLAHHSGTGFGVKPIIPITIGFFISLLAIDLLIVSVKVGSNLII